MRKTILIITTISILLNIGLVYLFVIKGKPFDTNDGRIELKMSKENKEFVLAEMRDFLESIQQINEGLLNKDTNKIIKAGEKSGDAVISCAPKGLLKTLPVAFKKLGFAAHATFDEISLSAKKDFDPKKTQVLLNKLLINCIHCHKAYKISIFNKNK